MQISTRLVDPTKKLVGNTSYEKPAAEKPPAVVATNVDKVAEKPSPAVADNIVPPEETHNGSRLEEPAKKAAAVELTPRLATFSPADSLESNVTLVSAGIHSEATDNKGTYSVQSMRKNKGMTEKMYSDGRVEICYPNGNRKEVSQDGKTTKVLYYNGDIKECLPSGLVKYFYSQTKTWHLTYPDGKEVLQFSKYVLRFPEKKGERKKKKIFKNVERNDVCVFKAF